MPAAEVASIPPKMPATEKEAEKPQKNLAKAQNLNQGLESIKRSNAQEKKR